MQRKTHTFINYGLDWNGPFLGDVQLLENTSLGFQVPPRSRLEARLAEAFDVTFDMEGLTGGLALICKAMNERDLTQAAIALRFLTRLDICRQAGVQIRKASPDDPLRPGWPAGTLDGRGGKFRPKDDADASGLKTDEGKKRVERLRARQTFRSVVRRLLTAKRVVRLVGEFAGDLIPGIDIASDIATVADLAQLAEELGAEVSASKAALAFAEKGPPTIDSLMVDTADASFSSYQSFLKIDVEKRYGAAGDGYEYHHIVEQGMNQGRFAQERLQSTGNIIRIPKLLHEEVNAFYASKLKEVTGDLSFRDFLRPQSFEEQQFWGRWALKRMDIVR